MPSPALPGQTHGLFRSCGIRLRWLRSGGVGCIAGWSASLIADGLSPSGKHAQSSWPNKVASS
eukprot:4603431-Alexandrium_andersonii.AAC.1